jgi:hypothetical protein
MSNFTFEYILLAILGMFIHVLMSIVQRRNKFTSISIKIFLADYMNWIRVLLSLTSTFVLLLMADDVSKYLGVTIDNGASARSLFAFLSGYLNHSIIKNILKVFKK